MKGLYYKFNFILLFLLVCFSSQSQRNLDSLWNVWNDENAIDSTRILALQKIISDNYLYSKPDSTLYFSKMMYDFSYDKGLDKGMAAVVAIGMILELGFVRDIHNYYSITCAPMYF